LHTLSSIISQAYTVDSEASIWICYWVVGFVKRENFLKRKNYPDKHSVFQTSQVTTVTYVP